MLTLEDFETIFLIVSLAGTLIVASPVLVLVFPSQGAERFSELYVLGPNRMAEGYPFNVRVGEQYLLFLGVGNHMGSSAYYAVYVKLRNQTQPLPDTLMAMPSPLVPLCEFRAFVADGETWEAPLTFAFLNVSRFGNSSLVSEMSINDVVFSVDCSSNSGYYQLFLELWLYDFSLQGFQYHGRFVGVWLNVMG